MVLCCFRANNTVVHCTIEKRDTGYGFAEPYFIHEKLLDLVMYYRETTLVEHNEILDVTLKYPVLAAASATMHGPSTPARAVRMTLSNSAGYYAAFRPSTVGLKLILPLLHDNVSECIMFYRCSICSFCPFVWTDIVNTISCERQNNLHIIDGIFTSP